MIKKLCAIASAVALSSIAYADTANSSTNNNDMLGNSLTITTSPLMGNESAYDGSDLMYAYPSINHDLFLLSIHQQMQDYRATNNITTNKPIMVISGGVEGGYVAHSQYEGSTQYSTSLNTAELDIAAFLNDWAQAFMSYDYQDMPSSSGTRDPQNEIYLSRGYATIGNLSKSPIYASIGQMYVPFGRYNSLMLTTTETTSLARILSTTTVLGFSQNGFSAQAFTYNTQQGEQNSFINEGGANISYSSTDSSHPYQIGASYTTNISDSQGMQDNGSDAAFQGFAINDYDSPSTPAYDLYGSMGIGDFTLIGEYISATKHFSDDALQFNDTGAKPKALQAELDYSTTINNKPTSFGIMFSQTWQALALNLPKNSYNVVANTSIWRDTVESIEYSYNTNYGDTDTSTGAGKAGPSGGGHSNVITAQLGVYF